MKPRALDLFCAAGGASRGLQLAGFHVTGVDIRPQPRYCGDEFHQADALEFPVDYPCPACGGHGIRRGTWVFMPNCPSREAECHACNGTGRKDYDFIWASPPCQAHSRATLSQRESGTKYPDLIEATRDLLQNAGPPWAIENVPDAPIRRDLMLCGSMFGLRLVRHRHFELSFPLSVLAPPCQHPAVPVAVAGHSTPSWSRAKNGGKNFTLQERYDAMGIDWMDRNSLSLAIPPAYSEFIGQQVMQILERAA